MVISPSGAAPAQTRGRGKNRPNKTKHPRRGRKNAKSYQRNKGKNIGQAPRKWIQLDRKPGPQARFMVPTWVAIDELTPEERSKHVPEDPVVQPPASSAVPAPSIDTLADAQPTTSTTGSANNLPIPSQGNSSTVLNLDGSTAASTIPTSQNVVRASQPATFNPHEVHTPQLPDPAATLGSNQQQQVSNGNDQLRHPTA